MIPRSAGSRQTSSWQRELAQAISDPAELLARLQLDMALLPTARQAAARFPLRVPRDFIARMQVGNPNDPLLRQILPWHSEILRVPGFVADPVGDMKALRAPGLLHKYAGRVLLMVTGACAVHCRYCFRRAFPYADVKGGDWRAALNYIARDSSISEVILSGGDPLMLSNRRLRDLIAELEPIAHLQRLRIHSRLPVVLPQRIETGLIDLLTCSRLQPVLVIHSNHPQEIDGRVAEALQRLVTAGIVVLNQTVLLKDINDSADILMALSHTLFRNRVIPYYLHLMDKAEGTAHFCVDESKATHVMETLRNQLSGYLVPRLVREEAGKHAKVPLL